MLQVLCSMPLGNDDVKPKTGITYISRIALQLHFLLRKSFCNFS
jgi:hypothetical protein